MNGEITGRHSSVSKTPSSTSVRTVEDRLEGHMLDGDLDAARAEVERGLARFPASFSLWAQKGRLCARLGRHDEALAAYEAAVVLDPGNAEAIDYFVGRARAQGDHLSAVDWLSRRLQRYRDDAQSYARRAMALRCVDRRRAAAIDAATALACLDDPGRSDPLGGQLREIVEADLARGEEREHEIVSQVCERLSRMQLDPAGFGARTTKLVGLMRRLAPPRT